MRLRKIYIDIEATYNGDINPDKSEEDKERFFKDFDNWKFHVIKEYNGKNVEYKGIIGLLILDFEIEESGIHRIVGKKFVQLIGEDCTKDNLMKELDCVNEIIGYHCRTKPSSKGYIGYDFGVLGKQLGVVLDELPGIKCIDLELLAHSAGMYGGLKEVENMVPTAPLRKSGVANGAEEEKLLLDIAFCEDKDKRKEMWRRARLYNREDTVNLVYIEQYLRKIKMTE